MKPSATNHPNLIGAMEFTNTVCSLLIALELSVDQLDADTIKEASSGIRYLASRAYEDLERVHNFEANK